MKKIKKEKTTSDWLPFEKILDNGIIEYKNYYAKIIKVVPINYDLKSNLEKEAILNSYKMFLKTCDFNMQIIIQSKKENLSKHLSNLQNSIYEEKNPKIKEIAEKYVEYIREKNDENKSSSKNFYIVIKYDLQAIQKENMANVVSRAENALTENYFKIKESLIRCGNQVQEVSTKNDIQKILISFYNPRMSEKFL